MTIFSRLLSGIRRFMGYTEQKAADDDDTAGRVVYAGTEGEPVSHPTSTMDELEFSWRHGYFFACLNKISTSAMGVPLQIKRLEPLERRGQTGLSGAGEQKRVRASERQGDNEAKAAVSSAGKRCIDAASVRRARLGLSSVPWESRDEWLTERGFRTEDVEAGHELVQLLDNPNRHATWPEFIQLSMMHLVGSGDCYWELVGGEDRQRPTALYVMQPNRVRVVPDAHEWVQEYEYTVNGERARLGRDEVLHFRLPHPMNDHYGLSRADSLELQLDTDYRRLIYNHRFFKVGARLGKLLTPKEGVELDPESAKRAVEQFKAEHQGVENMGKMCYFGVPVDITDTETAPKDIEFAEMKQEHEFDISAVTGVPRALTGRVEDANRSNMEVLSTLFWDTTMVPLMKVFCAKINAQLTTRYDSRIIVQPDFSVVQALSEETSSKSERVIEQLDAGAITVNEARQQLGLDPLPDGDVLKVDSDDTFVPAEERAENGAEGA